MKRSLSVGLVGLFALVGMGGVAAAEELRPLRMEAVDQVIEHADRAVQSCGHGRAHDTLAIILKLDIDADGKVVGAEPAGKITPAVQCLQRVARKLQFPATGTLSHFEYPFMLVPQLRR